MITPSFGVTATERVLPKLALDFTTAALDSRVTFTRTTGASNPATYVNSSGVITAATNNQPRFDYDPITFACKGLLIEESRTNLVTYSGDFTNASWAATAVTKTGGQSDLSGGSSAVLLDEGTTTNNHFVQSNLFSCTNGVTYTQSVYVKAGTATVIQLFFNSATYPTTAYANFDIANGVVGTVGAGVTAQITPAGNGWYRCSITGQCTINGNGGLFVAFTNNNTSAARVPSYTGASKTFTIYCGQFEAGAFATSYIPTTTTALTRNADVATMTGTNFSDWFNASEGTCYAEVQFNGYTTGSLPKIGLAISNGSTTERIQSWAATPTSVTSRVVATNASQAALTNTVVDITQNKLKVAFAYKANNFGASSNASSVQTDAAGIVASPDRAYICASEIDGLSGQLNGTVAKIMYWPQRLTNAELQSFSKV